MKHLKQSLMVVLLASASWTFAQDVAQNSEIPAEQGRDRNPPVFDPRVKAQRAEEERRRLERAKEVRQNSEYTVTGNEQGSFFENPLLINGTPLDYTDFSLETTGELTVIKKAPVSGETVEVPFRIYLRRNGTRVSLPGVKGYNTKQTKFNLSEILEHAKDGDHLIIEAVNKEDGKVKTILKLLNPGC